MRVVNTVQRRQINNRKKIRPAFDLIIIDRIASGETRAGQIMAVYSPMFRPGIYPPGNTMIVIRGGYTGRGREAKKKPFP
jgi:hypothetical protein